MRRGILALIFTLIGASVARADPPVDDARVRLREEYARTHRPAAGCELAELERRAGSLDAAAAILDAVLAATTEGDGDEATRTTLSACRYNRGRVHEDRGELELAAGAYAAALTTPNPRRRAVVEAALVRVTGRAAREGDCAVPANAIEARALLRFGDDASLRRCLRARERAAPICRVVRGRGLRELLANVSASSSRADGLRVTTADEGLVVYEGATPSRAIVCPALATPASNAFVRARFVLGTTTVLVVDVTEAFTFACDCDEGDDSDDCRCQASFSGLHLLTLDGRALLTLVDAGATFDAEMITPDWAEPAFLAETIEGGITLDGEVLVLGRRRLVLRGGALVPAPNP